MEGILEKKMRARKKILTAKWQHRYVLLDGTAFSYWHRAEDYESGAPPSKGNVYSLAGYHGELGSQ